MLPLKEIVEMRGRKSVKDVDVGYQGTAYIRYFSCSKGDVATHRASGGELVDGAVLPVKWGGVATSTAQDPRLQECNDIQKEHTSMALLETVWIEIDIV